MSPALLDLVNTFFYSGRLKPASGTWGSLAALAVGWGAEHYLGFPVLLALTLAVIPLGFYTVGGALKDRPGEDPSEIVIDEVAGMWIALSIPAAAFYFGPGVPMVWPGAVGAFLFFRLFDIWKPWIIGRADRRGDAAGVMLDDIWAGLFAAVATLIAAAVYHIVLI